MNEICQRCGLHGQDRRTLFMACLYDMSELGIPLKSMSLYGVAVTEFERTSWGQRFHDPPESKVEQESCHRPMYTLFVCKGCRSEWMQAIKVWYEAPPGHVSRWNNDAGVYGMKEDSVAGLAAEAEELRRQLTALEQRGQALARTMRRVHEEELRANDPERPASEGS